MRLPLGWFGWLACLMLAFIGCGDSTTDTSGGDVAGSIKEELAAAKAEANADRKARLLADVAERQQRANDAAGAGSTLALAADAAAKISEPAERATLQARIAELYARTGSATEGKRVAAAAAESAAGIADPIARFNALTAIADAQVQSKDRNGAAKSLDEARKLLDTLPPDADAGRELRKRADRLLALAQVQQRMGRDEEARKLFAQVREAADGAAQPRKKCEILARLAAVQYGLQLSSADAAAQAALAEARKIEEPLSKAHAFCDLAEQWREAGRGEQSAAMLQEAEQTIENVETVPALKTEVKERIARIRRG